MLIIIFTGPPASGKSSIANRVGEILGINVISKDECKIRLFETYGFTNHAEKKESLHSDILKGRLRKVLLSFLFQDLQKNI